MCVYVCSTELMLGDRSDITVCCLVNRTGGLSLSVSNRVAYVYIRVNKRKCTKNETSDIILRGGEARDDKREDDEGERERYQSRPDILQQISTVGLGW
jgi:hypothetical protein